MRVLVLGAGQEVGRSCVVVRMGRFTLMFDCGMHMGYKDERRFPDFGLLSPTRDVNSVIDALFISHFHLDHVGALPYFTGVLGYRGPVFMTWPTRAIAPLMLADYYNLLKGQPGLGPMFAPHHVPGCMKHARVMDLQETVQVCEGVTATAYAAGHVLGAAILHVQAGGESIVYTGDFNTVPERHLAGASLPRLAPDLLITESTYAKSVREGKRARERQLLHLVHTAVSAGGKVLFPVSAVGRAQELLLLLDEYWERAQLTVPIYSSGNMASRASKLYRRLLNWSSERVKRGPLGTRASAFGFGRVKDWNSDLLLQEGPCVLFATPGMLQGGTSLEVFKAWAPDARNLVLLPSYQVAGTLGQKLLGGQKKGVAIDSRTTLDVKCKVHYVSFSAHADAQGLMQLAQQLSPAAVMLVHGEPEAQAFMCSHMSQTLGVKCVMPAVGEELQLVGRELTTVAASAQLLRQLPLPLQLLADQGRAQQAPAAAAGTEDASAAQQQAGVAAGVAEAAAGEALAAGAGAAAAQWLKQGDVGQLVQAAMRLAGLTSRQPGAAAEQGATQQQQQQPLQARTRAAQLAPWLELLAAAAQQAGQPEGPAACPTVPPLPQPPLPQPQPPPPQQQQPEQAAADRGILADSSQQLDTSVATLSRQLQQQLIFDSQVAVVDAVLVVHHQDQQQQQQQQPAHNKAAAAPARPRMQLLPAAEAAAVLGVRQHAVRLGCRLKLPPQCWQHEQLQSAAATTRADNEGADAGAAEAASLTTAQPQALAAGLSFVAEVLQTGLSSVLSRQVVHRPGTADDGGDSVQLRSFVVRPAPPTTRSSGASDGCRQQMVMQCSWLLHDDVLAEQCVSLLRLAAASAAGNASE